MYETIKSELTYKGRMIDVVCDTIILPDGKEAVRECVVHGGASAIIPIMDNLDILLVEQYRHPAKAMTLEIPAGTLEKNEDPFICAKRELEEETGYYSDNISFLFKMYSAIGFCTEVLHIYVAKDLKKSKQNLDEDEFVTVKAFSIDEAFDKIFTGEIVDSKTISAVLALKNNRFLA